MRLENETLEKTLKRYREMVEDPGLKGTGKYPNAFRKGISMDIGEVQDDVFS